LKSRIYSKKREAILAKIQSVDCHPTAEWLYQELKDEFPDLSLATVYRNLAMFKEEGLITSVGTVSGKERYDGQAHNHGHLVCHQCREVSDFEIPHSSQIMCDKIGEMTGAKVDKVDIIAYGTCKECLDKDSGFQKASTREEKQESLA